MQSFDVKGMSCEHCAGSVEAAVHSVDPAAEVDVDFASGKMIVRGGEAPSDVLLQAIAAEGYEAVVSDA